MSKPMSLPTDWQQQDSKGSYDDAIGTLRKLEIAIEALLVIRAYSGERESGWRLEHIYRIANETLIQINRG
jgi:hypothetical protein